MINTQDLYHLEARLQYDAGMLAIAVDQVCFAIEDGHPVTVQDLTLVSTRITEMRGHIDAVERGVVELVAGKPE